MDFSPSYLAIIIVLLISACGLGESPSVDAGVADAAERPEDLSSEGPTLPLLRDCCHAHPAGERSRPNPARLRPSAIPGQLAAYRPVLSARRISRVHQAVSESALPVLLAIGQRIFQ